MPSVHICHLADGARTMLRPCHSVPQPQLPQCNSIPPDSHHMRERFSSLQCPQIRRYEPYMVAEVDMPRAAGPAAGEGFNDLAGYIFGGNNRCGAAFCRVAARVMSMSLRSGPLHRGAGTPS
jgi:SOUL heme-binding protein